MAEKEYVELAWPKGDMPEPYHQNEIDFSVKIKLKKIVEHVSGHKINKIFSVVPYISNSVVGRFAAETEKDFFFIRISKRTGDLENEIKILDYLFKNNAAVNPIVYSKIIDFESDLLRIDIRPYIESRFFNNSKEDIYKLGKGLGEIHKLLKKFEPKECLKKNSIKRYESLKSIKELIKQENDSFSDYSGWIKKNSSLLNEFEKKFDPFFHLYREASLIHGEVHPGNVIFSKKNDKIFFIDFEESVHTFAPITWDIGFVVQRFFLNDLPKKEIIKKRIDIFESGYGKKLPPFFDMMEQIVFFSLSVVFNLALNGVFTPVSELIKFSKIYKNIQNYKGVLK